MVQPQGPAAPLFEPALALPKKRSLTIKGHRTSITLEDAFWSELRAAAAALDLSVAALVSRIDGARQGAGLSGAIRVFLLERLRAMSVDSGESGF